MIAQSLKSSQYVQNAITGDIGQVYRIVLSPIGTEDTRGIQRAQVMCLVPGSDGHLYQAWDWWLIEDCIPVAAAPIPAGITVTVLYRKQAVSAVVLSTNAFDVCVMLEDGTTGWLSLSRVQSIVSADIVLESAS